MKLKGIIYEDLINYKKTSMVLEFPYCDFKCDKDCGFPVCQNSALAKAPSYEVNIDKIIKQYLNNPMTEAIVCQGLEPFESYKDLFDFISAFRKKSEDDIVIYTGFTEIEIFSEIKELSKFKNIILKIGRFIPNNKPVFDEILGVELASHNQYAIKI